MLTVSVEELDDVVILRCFGRIVHGEEAAILCAAARHYSRNVILDLKEVDAIDGTGIGLLISLQAAGLYIRLINPVQGVRELLQAKQLDSVLEISKSESAHGRIADDRTADDGTEEVRTSDRSEAAAPTSSWRVPRLVPC